jgi:ubiquinone/menaquinone biosynthesis C-methylase UbiE
MSVVGSDPRSLEFKNHMNAIYSEGLHGFYETVARNDFYGFVGEMTVEAFISRLSLTKESRVLDLCCGTGGPARYFAQACGCRVTGVDISEANVRIAQDKIKEVGLGDRVDFVDGNVLSLNTESSSYSHVFGCDAWCYFPDKAPLYNIAFRCLSPGGIVSFLDHACETPTQFHFENYLGSVYFESKVEYISKLSQAGFDSIRHYDLTDVASRDFSKMVLTIIERREQLITSLGKDVYNVFLEVWSEVLSNLCDGRSAYCGFTAQKPL